MLPCPPPGELNICFTNVPLFGYFLKSLWDNLRLSWEAAVGRIIWVKSHVSTGRYIFSLNPILKLLFVSKFWSCRWKKNPEAREFRVLWCKEEPSILKEENRHFLRRLEGGSLLCRACEAKTPQQCNWQKRCYLKWVLKRGFKIYIYWRSQPLQLQQTGRTSLEYTARNSLEMGNNLQTSVLSNSRGIWIQYFKNPECTL